MPDSPPRPEDRLLLACARTRPDAATLERIRLLAGGPLDWPALLRDAERHGVLPLLYWNLKAGLPAALPADLWETLRRRFQETGRANLFLAGELFRILERFAARGIPAVPYKGPVLAAALYGNLALRQFSDVDILIHRDDALSAKAILIQAGYRPHLALTPAQERAFIEFDREYPFDNGHTFLELHWETATQISSFRPDTITLWKRVQAVSLSGRAVPTLAPEDLLLVLCAHATGHLWNRLKWVCDIAEMLRARQDLDWDVVLREARRLHSTRILWLGVSLARDLLDAPVPAPVLSAMRADGGVAPLAAEVRHRLFAPAPVRTRDAYWFYLRARERPGDRLAYAARLALRPNALDCRMLSLPRGLYFFYYLARPVRLLRDYVLGGLFSK